MFNVFQPLGSLGIFGGQQGAGGGVFGNVAGASSIADGAVALSKLVGG